MLGTDMYVNGEAPFEFENDFFKGRMLFLVKCKPPDPRWASHFEGANGNRAFEMQIQGKLKLLPKGEVGAVTPRSFWALLCYLPVAKVL